MDVYRPSSVFRGVASSSCSSGKKASKKVPQKVLLVGQKAQQYRAVLAKKQSYQVAKLSKKYAISYPQIMPSINPQMRPPAPVYRAGVAQMPVRYMTTPNGMSQCTSPHQMMTDEIHGHTFSQMPNNYEYPDGRHLAGPGSQYENSSPHMMHNQQKYYQVMEQYGRQPRWECHPPGAQRAMYENMVQRGAHEAKPRMPVPGQFAQRNGGHGRGLNESPQITEAFIQSQTQERHPEQNFYNNNNSNSSSPVKFLKSGASTPGSKHRRYDEPNEDNEFEEDMQQVQRVSHKSQSRGHFQRAEKIQNNSESTLDFRDNTKPSKPQASAQENHGQYQQEQIYDSHPNPKTLKPNRPSTPEDDCFPPPPRSTSTNMNPQTYQNQSIEPARHTPNRHQKMALNNENYENTLERPMKDDFSTNPVPPPPRQNRQVDHAKQKPIVEQRKSHNPPTRGFASLDEVELKPVNSKSQEKQDLENWAQLVPHKKVASVIQMLNQKEATNGTLLSGNQIKNKQPQSRTTPQLQRQNTQNSVQNTPQVQRHQLNLSHHDSELREVNKSERSTPHQHFHPESPQYHQEGPPLEQKRDNVLQRNQNSNFVPYNQHPSRPAAQAPQNQQQYQNQQEHRIQSNRYEQDIYEDQQMYQQQRPTPQRHIPQQTRQHDYTPQQARQQDYYQEEYEMHQNVQQRHQLQQQKPIPQHRNSINDDYYKETARAVHRRNDVGQLEPAKVTNNPPPAPPLPEGGVLKPSASRKNSLNPSASNADIPNLPNINKNRNSQQSQHSSEDKSQRSNGSVSISTDSALSSDDYTNNSNKLSLHDSTLDSTNDLNTEAEILLLYFKTNLHVLSYLGINLPEDLWQHIRSLPDKRVKLKIYEEKPSNRKNPRTQNGKVVRRVSCKGKNVETHERRQRRKSNLMGKQDEERKRDSFLAGQAVSFGDAVISISKGPYPGYAGGEPMVHEVTKIPPAPMFVDKRTNPNIKDKENEIMRDFNDLTRQMNVSEMSMPINMLEDATFPRARSGHPPINRNISVDSLTEDELLKQQSNDELEERRSLKHDVTDTEGDSPAKWNFLKKSGRFVKKSAAALIAKKQTSTTNSPVPTMKVANAKMASIPRKPFPEFKQTEYKIAEEIAMLREREDELRRNRSALGLPSLDDIVETWRHGHEGPRMVPHPRQRYHYEEMPLHGSPLRAAQSFDHLHIRVQEEKPHFDEFDGTGYTIGAKVTKSESFNHLHSRMDEYYYEKTGLREHQQYGTDQFVKNQRGRRAEREIINGFDASPFDNRAKMASQSHLKNEKIQQVNIKIHPAKRTETLDSNRTAESRKSMKSGNSSQKSHKKRFFTYAMPVMRL